jgi:hypothetical protein
MADPLDPDVLADSADFMHWVLGSQGEVICPGCMSLVDDSKVEREADDD